jgi:hypothetical protein
MRTIIDVLRKGNQELFHSSVVAWLLDPVGEHGLGHGFLHAFARLVESHGCPRMREALDAGTPTRIATEATARNSRYDIVVRIGPVTVVIENKTKSLGDEPQFKKYGGDKFVLVALGLCPVSFSRAVHDKYPVVTYAEVLSALDALPPAPPSDFRVLVDHYRRFLRRELAVLTGIDEWYSTGGATAGAAVRERVEGVGGQTENDRRFLNLYLLEHLKHRLEESARWRGCRPETNKNMQSGVWLAVFDAGAGAGGFRFAEPLAVLWRECRVPAWFHVELWDGVLAKADDDVAGVIQLRCSTDGDPKAVANRFRAVRQLRAGEKYPSKTKAKTDSFYLLARPILKRHLTRTQFVIELVEFAESLGTFTTERRTEGTPPGEPTVCPTVGSGERP